MMRPADMLKYLRTKCAGSDLDVFRYLYQGSEHTLFMLTAGGCDFAAAISVSSLEELQNPSEEALRHLLDARFEAAANMLKRAEAA